MAVAEKEKMWQLIRALQSYLSKLRDYSAMLDQTIEDYSNSVENDDLSKILKTGISSAREGGNEGVGEIEIAKQTEELAERVIKDMKTIFKPVSGE